METNERRAAAIERLTAKRDLTYHAAMYLAVNILLVIVWAATGGGTFWPIWPIAGWGLGLAAHAWGVLGQKPLSERRIADEMRRLDDTRDRADH